MHNASRRFFSVAVLVALAAPAFAAEPATSINVDGMHCAMCTKKLTTKIQSLPGVAAAVGDVKSGVVTVTPKTRTNLSPKSLWETVEASGYKPTKLSGPAGTFTSKPKQ